MKVVVSEFMDVSALEGFGAEVQVDYKPGLVDDRPALLEAVADADALIVRNRTQVDGDLLAAGPGLKVIGRLGVGLDNIDLDACAACDVAVCPATGANTLSVVEYVIGTAMSLLRTAYSDNAAMIAGKWPRARLQGGEIAGRTLGLIGYGGIGRALAARASGLGMDVIAHDPHLPANDPGWAGARSVDMAALLATADVISLHVPLTDGTRGLIGGAALASMKEGAILINTARGGVVDEAALAAALRDGHLGGAALDVFEVEPLTAEAAAVFDGVPNLILTPHIAGLTAEGNDRVSTLTVENVKNALA